MRNSLSMFAFFPIIVLIILSLQEDHKREFQNMSGVRDIILPVTVMVTVTLACALEIWYVIKGMPMNRQSILTNEDATASTPLTPNPYDNNGASKYRCKIGKMVVTENLIAKGSDGTSVLEGEYDGRRVAVKRILRRSNLLNFAEKNNLTEYDQHQNINRLYGVERDRHFDYLCLELCTCNLFKLITYCASSPESRQSLDICSMRNLGSDQELELWNNNLPSALLLRLMREVAYGLEYLHYHRIIHRDLKPHNILLKKDISISSKISDLGISKRLDVDMSSLLNHSTGLGSLGWQAPEQLHHKAQTCAVDLFSLGCTYYFCLSRGKHPFPISIDCNHKISYAPIDLSLIDHLPEAKDLICRLLNHDPEKRPNATKVKHHPLFWDSDKRISFLLDVSDRLEKERRKKRSKLLQEFEGRANYVLDGKPWDTEMHIDLINDIERSRSYNYKSLQDLVRVIRNKRNHQSDHSETILGPIPEGFYSYFSTRFPELLIEVYHFIRDHCSNEEKFHRYFN